MNPRKLLTFLLVFIVLLNISYGNPVKILIRDTDKTTLVGATVKLTRVDDSNTIFKTTDIDGIAVFDKVSHGLYAVNISYVGYTPLEKAISVKQGNNNFNFVMEPGAINLDEVTITARRPLIRQEGDKMIIDPEPIASISTNTLEILESTPGLYVDQDGGIFLTSATPATVYINGREQKMSSQDINTILRSLPPNSVERIEIMRTPSARYDAASSGGIINIILKKGVKIGRFGSVNTGMNQGVYGNRFAGFSFNNSGDKSTSYVILNYNYNDLLEEINSTRLLDAEKNLMQSADTRRQNNSLYLGYGVNYDLNESFRLNYDGRVNGNFRKIKADNSNIINELEEIIISESSNIANTNSNFLSVQQDLGMLYKVDTLGSELDIKLSYSYGGNNSEQDYLTEMFSPIISSIAGRGNNVQNRHFLVFQSDLTYRLPLEIIMELGIKSSYQQYHSDADYYLDQNGTFVNDLLRTNAFNYKENINAGYIQASRDIGLGFMLKGGVRFEHTHMDGNQVIPVDTNFLVNRVDWFPYVFLSRKIIEIFDISLDGYLIYRKTINRPGYNDLNPYVRFVDQFMNEAGNPSLKPQFTENFEANISFNDMPLFAIGQNRTKDIFSSVMYQDENQPGVLLRTFDNLGQSTETYFRAIAGIPPGRKYFFAVGAQYNYLEYDGVYENEPFSFTNGSWRLFTFHSLRLFRNTRLTMSGFMMTNGQWNFYELKNFGQINFGLTQNFLNNKLTITLSGRDVLRTMVTEFEFNQGSVSSYGSRYTDNMRFGINIRYNFGIKPKEDRKEQIPQMDMDI